MRGKVLIPACDTICEVYDRLSEFRAIQIHVPNDERDEAKYENYLAHRPQHYRHFVGSELRNAAQF